MLIKLNISLYFDKLLKVGSINNHPKTDVVQKITARLSKTTQESQKNENQWEMKKCIA